MQVNHAKSVKMRRKKMFTPKCGNGEGRENRGALDMKSKHDAKNATWSQKNRYKKTGITAVIHDEQMNSVNAM